MMPEDILFPRQNGKPFESGYYLNSTLLKNACKDAKIDKKITCHSFRHGFTPS